MTNPENNKELKSILESLGEDILDAPKDEILELYKEADLDPNEGVERIKGAILESINSYKRKAIKAARLNQEEETKKKEAFISKIPESLKGIK